MDSLTLDLLKLASVTAFVLANAFFVATEFALVSMRRSRIEQLVAEGHLGARVVQAAARDLGRYIVGVQLGVTLASLALGWIGEPALAHLLEPLFAPLPHTVALASAHGISATVAFAAITFLHVVFGELVPKSMALQRAEKVALWFAGPMRLLMALFRPCIWALNGAANGTLRLMGLRPAGDLHAIHSVEELQILVRHSRKAGVLDEMESKLVERAFRFPDLTASDVMIPRPDMAALDAAEPADELLDTAARSAHTRLPVYERNMDNIIGILHMQDVFRVLRKPGAAFDVRQLVRPALFVPETTPLDSLLRTFQQNHAQIAVVTDEHGGVAGLVTLDDVVEEIVGEVEEGGAEKKPGIEKTDDGRVLVRGDVRLRELNDHFGWTLQDELADTIAGYVMNRLGRLARVGDTVETSHGVIRVENMERVRIVQVSITPKSAGATVPTGSE